MSGKWLKQHTGIMTFAFDKLHSFENQTYFAPRGILRSSDKILYWWWMYLILKKRLIISIAKRSQAQLRCNIYHIHRYFTVLNQIISRFFFLSKTYNILNSQSDRNFLLQKIRIIISYIPVYYKFYKKWIRSKS